MPYAIEPNLPRPRPLATREEARAVREANRPLREKFARAVKGKTYEGFSTREAAEAMMRSIDFEGVPVRVCEYVPLHIL